MQIRLTVVDPTHADLCCDVVLEAAVDSTTEDIRPALLRALGRADDGSRLFVDGDQLGDHRLVGVPPLVDGALVTVARPGSTAGRQAGRVGGFLELHVAEGPDAGRVHRLHPGEHRIGRAGVAEVCLDDPDASRWHARVDLGPEGVGVRDLTSTNGTRLDGEPLGSQPHRFDVGSRLSIGSSTLMLRRPDVLVATTTPTGHGTIDVNRSPRIRPPRPEVVVRLPTPPEEPKPARVPLLAMLLPVVVAVPLAFIWSPYALVFAVMSPVMLVGTLVSDRRSGRRDHRRALGGYAQARALADERLAAALVAELSARREDHPDAGTVARVADGRSRRLWERRRDDPDVLELRIGTARLPAGVRVTGAGSSEPLPAPTLDEAPVTVPLSDVGVLGVAGPRGRALGLVRSLVSQVAVLHSPRDVACVVLSGRIGGGDDWAWATWLPHLRPESGGVEPPGDCRALIGTDPEQVRRRVAALDALLTSRRGESRPGSRWSGPRVVVVLDGAGRLRTVPGVARLLEQGPAVGLHFVCLDDDPASLPGECRATVLIGGEVGTRVEVRVVGEPELSDVVADLVGARVAGRLARALAPLRDATPAGSGPGLPDQVRLLDLLGTGAVSTETLRQAWSQTPRSTKALLGATASGPFVVDLRLDGPHVLVAGTTGSGKSELLRTLVTSLALGNRPDEMVFVLVDYKGGAAFEDCARFPHTVGVVTDLDGHLTQRALESLQAELRRRERLLKEHGAADLDAYQALVDEDLVGQAGLARLPRLVLVVDEFRVLAEELPEFVAGLVRVAAVGRSLGLHLVLATQRPGGVVSADMRANVNLRIALRVRDAMDSTDVVESMEATAISERTPGRAYVRAGSNPLVAVQTAHVAGRATDDGPPLAVAHRTTVGTLGAPPPRAAARGSALGPSDLDEIVGLLQSATHHLGLTPAASPWQPPLPDLVSGDDVRAAGDVPATALAYGLVDLPAQQRREPLAWDLARDGCLAVVGTSRSGRTSALRAIVAAAATRWSPAELGVYALDGGGRLGDLAHLPHVGAVVPRDDTDRTARVLRLLTREVARRSALTPDAGPQPRLLLVVDGWESLRATHDELDGVGLDPVLQLVREGPGVGVLTVLAGDRSVLMGAAGAAFAERLVLRMADPTDAVLAGVPARDVPAHLPPGRGLRVGTGGVREVQVALLSPDETPRWPKSTAPQRVPAMPDVVARDHLASGDGSALPLGLGGDDVRTLSLDLTDDGPCILVAGHPRSGRSTTLLTLAAGLAASGRRLVVVTPRRSPLEQLHPGEHLARFGTGDGDAMRRCLDTARDAGSPAAVLVDDVELVDSTSVEPVLMDLLARAETSGELCLLAGSTPELVTRFAGVGVQARKRGVGVLLGPASPLDGDLFGLRVSRRPERRPGRGLLVRHGTTTPLQVARPSSRLR